MTFSLASLRSNKAPLKADHQGLDRVASAHSHVEADLSQAKGEIKVDSIAWAIATAIAALGSIAWAIALYLIEREKQRSRVELARLEMETKKLVSTRANASQFE